MARHRFAVLVLVLTLLGPLALGGCIRNLGREPAWGKPSTLLFDLDGDVAVPDRCAVVFIADGLDRALFEEMLAAGELPHIQKYLVDRGVWIREAVTSLPTVTYAVMTSYATGRFPGHHGILGNKWFDPQLQIRQNYVTIDTMGYVNGDIEGPTVYELLDREDSVVVLTQVNRGCGRFYENFMRVGPAWYFHMFRNVSMSTTARLQNTVWRANDETGRWPELITLYYPSTDEVGHLDGHRSEPYREMVRVFDLEVGDACKAFEAEGLLDHMLLVMVTDHGMADTSKHQNVAKALRAAGLRVPDSGIVNRRSGGWHERRDKFDDADAVVVIDSERFAKVTLRVPGLDWNHRPTLAELRHWPHHGALGETSIVPAGVDLVRLCLDLPATDLVVHSDRGWPETRVTVYGAEGMGVITRRITPDGRKLYAYEVISRSDPLGYADDPRAAALVDGGFRSADAWFNATVETDRPDFVGQLPEVFDSLRAGDLALFARDGWDFGRHNRSGHGGLTRDEAVVPMLLAGPGLPQGATMDHARTVSLVPTLVHWIRGGVPPEMAAAFDGDSLLDNLPAASQNGPSLEPAGAAAD